MAGGSDAEDGPAGRERTDLLAVAHDRPVRPDAFVLLDRAQPSPELVRDDRRDRDGIPGQADAGIETSRGPALEGAGQGPRQLRPRNLRGTTCPRRRCLTRT